MHLPKVFSRALRQSSQLSLARWAPFLLRLIVGCGFMEHGYAKIARGPEHFAGILTAMGVPGVHLTAPGTPETPPAMRSQYFSVTAAVASSISQFHWLAHRRT
jgi:uncharacterized membrane protein YphA (DoxX/SURF4 family)